MVHSKLKKKMKKYLKESGRSIGDLSKKCGVSEGHLRNIIYKTQKASTSVKMLLEIATGGFITMEDFDE